MLLYIDSCVPAVPPAATRTLFLEPSASRPPPTYFLRGGTWSCRLPHAVQIDWAINTATHVYHNNLKGFEKTFDHLLRNTEHRVRILKVKLYFFLMR